MHRIIVALAMLALAGAAAAQTYPHRQVRWIIPYPPGGATDAMSRIAAQKLGEKLNITVVAENRGGGNGTVGSHYVAQQPPDGSVLLASASIHVMCRHVLRSCPYDPVADFTAIARVAEGPLLLLANNDVPGATIPEVVTAIRANPGAYNFSTSSLGAAGHLAIIEFLRLAGTDVTIVPYRGTGPSLTDLMGGRVQFTIEAILAGLPHVRGGRLRALAITAATRSPAAPEIPTAAEAGMPGLEFFSWYAVWGPKGMDPALVRTINTALQEGMQEPAVAARLTGLGFTPVAQDPATFADFIQRDIARNAALLRQANYQPE